MKVFKHSDYKNGEVRIKPEGWIDELVFETAGFQVCGQTEMGMGVRINDEAGGVLTLDDLTALHNIITEHLKKVTKTLEQNVKQTND